MKYEDMKPLFVWRVSQLGDQLLTAEELADSLDFEGVGYKVPDHLYRPLVGFRKRTRGARLDVMRRFLGEK